MCGWLFAGVVRVFVCIITIAVLNVGQIFISGVTLVLRMY